ncbi:MAG: PIN domain-containing protein [Candidatus Methylomirabilis oxyfera]|nr:PIN domain-containing protein [Candidatus Methylomirabilis oxyfera]
MVIADTSLWIEYFKGGNEPARAALRTLIRTEQVVLVGVVLAELLQGCRSSEEADTILSNLAGLRFLETSFSTWKQAGELSASLRRKGVTLPLSDLIIGTLAIEHRCQVYTFDTHFKHIPDLKLYAPPRLPRAR